jgi:hypothetical protein
MVTMPESLALTVFLIMLVALIVATGMSQYYYDKTKRLQDAIAYMIEEETEE